MNTQNSIEILTEAFENRIDPFTIDDISKYHNAVMFGPAIFSKSIVKECGYNICDYCGCIRIGYDGIGLETDVQILTINNINICQLCLPKKAENVTKTFNPVENDVFCRKCVVNLIICKEMVLLENGKEDLVKKVDMFDIYKFNDSYIIDILRFFSIRYEDGESMRILRDDLGDIQQEYGKHYLTCSENQCANRLVSMNYKPFSKSGIIPSRSFLSRDPLKTDYSGERIGNHVMTTLLSSDYVASQHNLKEGVISSEDYIIPRLSYESSEFFFTYDCILCKIIVIFTEEDDEDEERRYYDEFGLCKDCDKKFEYCEDCEDNILGTYEITMESPKGQKFGYCKNCEEDFLDLYKETPYKDCKDCKDCILGTYEATPCKSCEEKYKLSLK